MKLFYAFLLLIVIDYLYLSQVSSYYKGLIHSIQKSSLKMKMIPTIFVYLFIYGALYYFVLKDRKPAFDAFILGVVLYGVFDMTNMALFDNWGLLYSIIDIVWGGILLYTTTLLTYKLI